MPHDAFISYSSKDKPTADAVCAILETECIRCWVAPRDVMAGADWGESILAAIKESRVMVLILSANANESPHIRREVERAVSWGIPIIPLRVEKVVPAKSLELFVSSSHWLDAFNPPLERHLRYLAQVIHKILLGPTTANPSAKAKPVTKEVVAEILKEASVAMNEIKFHCAHCGQAMTVDAAAVGTTIACPACGQPTQIPMREQLDKLEGMAKTGKRGLIWTSVILAFLLLGTGVWWMGAKRKAEQMSYSPQAMISSQAQPVQSLVLSPSDELQAVQAKEKWIKALNDAISDFQADNNEESANFVSGILTSLDQPGGMDPDALAADLVHINNRIRELVQHGAMESAVRLQNTLYRLPAPLGPAGPANPNNRTGGKPDADGLVLYLPFNKPDEDGIVHDESGAGNDGRVYGAQWVADRKFGGAYQFHITNLSDRIVIPNSDTLNPDYITIAAWVKTTDDKDGFWNRIVDKHYSNYCLSFCGMGSTLYGKAWFETSHRGYLVGDSPVDDNQWHHIAVTFDGKTIGCFVDGIGKRYRARNPGPLKKSPWDLCIGNSVVDYGTGEFLAFDGLIGEVRIYNRALSAEEIRTLAAAKHAGTGIVASP